MADDRNASARQLGYRRRNQEIANEAKDVPCTDCGGRFPPVCMDFDHIGDNKRDNVAEMCRNGLSVATLLAEIAKCEVVCSNCHRIRTSMRTSHQRGATMRCPSSQRVALEIAAPRPSQ